MAPVRWTCGRRRKWLVSHKCGCSAACPLVRVDGRGGGDGRRRCGRVFTVHCERIANSWCQWRWSVAASVWVSRWVCGGDGGNGGGGGGGGRWWPHYPRCRFGSPVSSCTTLRPPGLQRRRRLVAARALGASVRNGNVSCEHFEDTDQDGEGSSCALAPRWHPTS